MERAASWENRSKFIDEELEFYTELALHETERWIQVGLDIDLSPKMI